MNKQQKRISMMFLVVGIIIIPVYTIIFAMKDNMFEFTLSIIGNMEGNRKTIIVWGLLISMFFLVGIGYLMTAYNIKTKSAKKFLNVSCVLLFMTVITPFMPEIFPILSKFHNVFAFLGIILLLITMYIFIIGIKKTDKGIYKKAMFGMTTLVIISSFVLLSMGLSGFFEGIMVIGLSVLLFLMNYWIIDHQDDEKINKKSKIINEDLEEL